jgi:uncharacterized protein (TIGR00106 family)
MAILEISVVPIGTSDTSLSAYVADCLRLLKKEKVRYELSSMGTNIEGDLKDLFKIALKMHQTPFKKGALRVLTTLKIDDRRDKKGTLEGKKKAVQEKLRAGNGLAPPQLPARREGLMPRRETVPYKSSEFKIKFELTFLFTSLY